MSASLTAPQFSRWELAAETIAVKMRWFGLVVGSVVVAASPAAAGNRPVLGAILTLGLVYAVLVDRTRVEKFAKTLTSALRALKAVRRA